MKVSIINLQGNKAGEIELPSIFKEPVRADLICRAFLASRSMQKQAYGNYILAGKEICASGKQSHRRRKWKTLYGGGNSRVPRKIMSRRGERFYWIGAFASGTVGGMEAHPPRPVKNPIKLNKKEKIKAMISALSATSQIECLKKRYEKYDDKLSKELILPLIFDKIEGNGKEVQKLLLNLLEKKIGNLAERLVFSEKKVRAGKGKLRNRKYRKTTGLLLVVSSNEAKKTKLDNFGIETVDAKKLGIENLAPGSMPGRFTLYTSEAIEELKNKFSKK